VALFAPLTPEQQVALAALLGTQGNEAPGGKEVPRGSLAEASSRPAEERSPRAPLQCREGRRHLAVPPACPRAVYPGPARSAGAPPAPPWLSTGEAPGSGAPPAHPSGPGGPRLKHLGSRSEYQEALLSILQNPLQPRQGRGRGRGAGGHRHRGCGGSGASTPGHWAAHSQGASPSHLQSPSPSHSHSQGSPVSSSRLHRSSPGSLADPDHIPWVSLGPPAQPCPCLRAAARGRGLP